MSTRATARPGLSVVVPVLNEARNIQSTLEPLQAWRGWAEILLVDGGSSDDTPGRAADLCDVVLYSAPGRALQMNLGASQARGDYLMFLHGDTRHRLCPEAIRQVLDAAPAWGFFPLRLSGEARAFRVIERAISLRSRLTGVATGDQCLFVSRALWEACGGFAEISLMEDVELSKRLRQQARPRVMPAPVSTSSRRWEQRGILRTVLLMWYLRLRYWLGADPDVLARRYRD